MLKPQRRWTSEEDVILQLEAESQLAANNGEVKSWRDIAEKLPGRTNKDCRKRFYNSVAQNLKKGQWAEEEDALLKACVTKLGPSWAAVAEKMGSRNADQCSKRWQHCLDPELDHSSWTTGENNSLFRAVKDHGTAWKYIQTRYFPKRSANNVKNQYTILKRRAPREPPESPRMQPIKEERVFAQPVASQAADVNMSEPSKMDLDINFQEFTTPGANSHENNWDHGFHCNQLLEKPYNHQRTFSYPQYNEAFSSQPLSNHNAGYGLADFSSSLTNAEQDIRSPYTALNYNLDRQEGSNKGREIEKGKHADAIAASQEFNGHPTLSPHVAVLSLDAPLYIETIGTYLWGGEEGNLGEGESSTLGADGSRITITVDNPDPRIIEEIVDVLIKSKAIITVQT